MTADIIPVDFKSKRRLYGKSLEAQAVIIPVDFKSKRRLHGKSLEAQAVEIINVALIGSGGIDDLVYETSMGWVGYPPASDEPVYVAPEADPA